MSHMEPALGRAQQLNGHYHDPKGSGAKTCGCGVCDAQLPPPLQILNDIFSYTTEELCSVTT
jgi:hypothetical protein